MQAAKESFYLLYNTNRSFFPFQDLLHKKQLDRMKMKRMTLTPT